jgi:uracil-DNA glycosylase
MTVAIDSENTRLNSNLAQLEAVREKALRCQACRLHETRQNVVFFDGNPEARVLFIGEGPGQQEDETGIPFVGRAGQLLTKIIESVGFNRQTDTYICNIVKCRPPGNREPMADEAAACAGFLQAQLDLVRPDILVLVGKTAYRGIYNIQGNIRIGQLRGQWLESPFTQHPEMKVMTIFHPSYLLRNPSPNEGTPKWLTWQDMQEIRRVYDELPPR